MNHFVQKLNPSLIDFLNLDNIDPVLKLFALGYLYCHFLLFLSYTLEYLTWKLLKLSIRSINYVHKLI